jgi:DNA-binding transcriptional LysR family regulator
MPVDVDLNLLKVFDALLDAGSVTGAAERLHLSVPATSRALGRLRLSMGDPILVRAGRSMVATPFALQSAGRVRSLLDDAAGLMTDDRALDPAKLLRTFNIRINDGIAATLAAGLIRRVSAEAPGVTLRFVPEGDEDIGSLRDGTLDLDVGTHHGSPPDLTTSLLYTEELVGFVAAASTLGARRRPSAKQLCLHRHVSTSRRGKARGPLDDALGELGLERQVAAVVGSFPLAAFTAVTSDLVALVPRRLAQQYADRLGARWFRLPVKLPTLEIGQQWHVRHDQDPAHAWLRTQVAATV